MKHPPRHPLSFLTGSLALGLSLVLPLTASAQDSGQNQAIVWEVPGKNGNTVYIAGSVHLLRSSDYPLPEAYDEAYADSERMYYEVDMATSQSMEMQMKILEMGQFDDGSTIRDHLSEETLALYDTWAKKRGIGGPMLEKMRPGMLAMTIGSLEAVSIGAQPHLGVESVYHQKALADQKPETGLETVEFQIGLFTGMCPEEQERLLATTLEQASETEKMLGDLIDAWKKGDAEELDHMLNDQFEEEEALMKSLLWDRNANWIPAIVNELETGDGNAMVIVGAGHLVGEKSVIALLEGAGYKPVQMTW